MNLFKINNFKTKKFDWGLRDEFFIYPVDSSYEDKNFKIRVSRINIENMEEGFDKNIGFKRFLVPISNNFAINFNNNKMLIRKDSTFRFKGSDDVVSLSCGQLFNLMLEEDVDGKVEVVKFKDKLIINDSFSNNKILFAYNLRDDLEIKSEGKSLSLKKDEFAILIPSGKYEIEFIPTNDDNAIIWGKVNL